jgi:sulfur relay (sulfurtransferase) complex TusBCD TusD component (DsrE family)
MPKWFSAGPVWMRVALTTVELVAGTARGTMAQLARLTLAADKVLVF